jgi:hypothetical protein
MAGFAMNSPVHYLPLTPALFSLPVFLAVLLAGIASPSRPRPAW